MAIWFLASAAEETATKSGGAFDWTTLITSALVAAVISALVAMIGQWVSRQNAKLAAEIARENAKLSASLEVAKTLSQSRQDWINILREDMAQYVGLAAARSRALSKGDTLSDDDFSRMVSLTARIRMRMNSDDEDFAELIDLMGECASKKNPGEIGKAGNQFNSVCQRILKREWEVLKSELRALNSASGADG